MTRLPASAPDSGARAPLEVAILFGDLKTVETLLEAGARAGEATSTGLLPMELAFHRGRYDVGELLLKYGAVSLCEPYETEGPCFIDWQGRRYHLGPKRVGRLTVESVRHYPNLNNPGVTIGLSMPDPKPW